MHRSGRFIIPLLFLLLVPNVRAAENPLDFRIKQNFSTINVHSFGGQTTKKNLETLMNAGLYFQNLGVADSAILCFRTGIFMALNTNRHLPELAEFYRRLGGLYIKYSNFAEGIQYYQHAIETILKAGDEETYVLYLSEMGNAYIPLDEPDKALECYTIAKTICEKNNYGNLLVRSLNSIGDLMRMQGKADSAIYYHEQALDANEKITGSRNEYWACTSLGKIYAGKNDCERAAEYFSIILEKPEASELSSLAAQAYINLALCDKKNGFFSRAISHGEKAYEMSIRMPEISLQSTISKALSSIYEEAGNPQKSLHYYKVHKLLSDSLKFSDQKKQISEMAFNQKEERLLDEVEKNNHLLAIEKSNREIESTKYMNVILIIVMGLLATIVYGLVIYFNLRKNRQQKKIIQEQKEDILHSIHYARRIQNAILPADRTVKENLRNSFIFYQPKDIVAGDFYWFEAVGDTVIIAAADCTGHGVPGAMVSVVCHNALNRCVREFKLTEPGKILDQSRKLVIETFAKSDEEVKDGMDISLCALHLKTNMLEWAGANNPLWLIRKNARGNAAIEEFKPDKQPIGRFITEKPFSTQKIQLNEGDTFYVFTDGFADQFGGKEGKKFKARALKELLTSVSELPIDEQPVIIGNSFNQWKGEYEQVDDVCLIGVKI